MSDPAIVLLLERLLVAIEGLRADLAARTPAPPPAPEPEGLLTAKQAAGFLRMSESWVYQHAESGELPCIHLGGALRFDPGELRAYARGEPVRQATVLPLAR